jgi:hypothetical protein
MEPKSVLRCIASYREAGFARMQIWGEIEQGQKYQHAVCFIKDWAVIVDLTMATRASKLVPSHPYWALDRFPWWLYSFEFETYHLEYRGYETHPEQVQKAKEIIRKLIMSFIEISAGFDQGQRFRYTELAGKHKRTDKGFHGERGPCDYATLCAKVSKSLFPLKCWR